jgi:hypothetical protein
LSVSGARGVPYVIGRYNHQHANAPTIKTMGTAIAFGAIAFAATAAAPSEYSSGMK